MHVSLHRRSHRVGLSLHYLLWICFGLLAVVPWQIICGQEISAQSGVAAVDDSETEPDQLPEVPSPKKKAKKTTQGNSSIHPLVIPTVVRGQSEYPPAGAFAMQPMQPIGPMGPTGPMTPADPMANDSAPVPPFMSDDRLTGQSGQSLGVQYRASYLTGPAIGRQHDIIPLEMMPYSFVDNWLVFADIRGFAATSGGFGGNFGGGIRRYLPRFDRILGFNTYFDYDASSGATFREVGFGAESLGALYDVRANAYMPVGPSNQQLSLTNINGSQVFTGHNLLVNQAKLVADALRGFDAEIGVPLPGRAAMRQDLRVFGGGYYFQGDQISTFGGWKARIQGNVTPNIQLGLQVSSDQQFHTNVVFNASWSFGGYKQMADEVKTQYSRMTTPVVRSYNMIVGLTTQVLTGVTVLNPTTNTPYFFEHVSNNALNPVAGIHDGTVEHPFLNLTDAQAVATANNIIFVHGNSVYGTTVPYPGQQVSLQQNIRVLGESTTVEHQIATFQGPLLLPHPTPANAAAPIFANSPGAGVVLANNSEFSGFQIVNPATFGIVGTGVSNVTLRQDTVTGSVNSGVSLTGTSGTITMLGDTINDPTTATATTFFVSGTTGTIIFSSDPLSDLRNAQGQAINTPGVINNVLGTGGMALDVTNTAIGSVVNFTGSTVNDTTGNGILIFQNAGVVSLGDTNVTNGLGIGIDILNNSGTVIGNGTLNVTNSIGDSIVVQGTAAGSNILFTNPGTAGTGLAAAGINITNRQARGIYLEGNAGNITFLTPINIAAAGPLAFSAIDYQANSATTVFDSLVNLNGGGNGITIGNAGGVPAPNTGSFSVNANTTINNMTGTSILITNDQSTVTFNGGLANNVLINNRGGIGIQVLANQGTVGFGGTTTINNQNAATVPAVDIRRNNIAGLVKPNVTFNTLSIENATGPAGAPFGGIGLNIGGPAAVDANSASVTVNTLNIGDQGAATFGTALYVNNEGTNVGTGLSGLTIGSGTINATFGQAVEIDNSTMRVILTAVSSSFSPTNGITLLNDQSFTPLPNNVTAPLLNDYMFQILGNPAAVLRNGGIISNATNDGILINQTAPRLFQTGDVNLNQVTLTANNNGLVASGLLQLNLSASEINLSKVDGFLGTNIPEVNVFTSYFDLNGTVLSAGNAIHLTANSTMLTTNRTAGQYLWTIQNNNTNSAGLAAGFFGAVGAGNLVQVDSGGQTLKVQTTSTITTVTPLVFNFVNNTVLMQPGVAPVGAVIAPATSGLFVNWTGFESGSINQNTFTLTGFNSAISIVNADATYLTNFFILGNSITGTNGGNFGLFVNDFGPTDLNVGTLLVNGKNIPNTFTFNTPAGVVGGVNTADIAMDVSVLNSTTTTSFLSFIDNQITMRGSAQDQGMVFPILQGASPGPTIVNLSNNNINVNIAPTVPINGTGIDFQTILGTIQLEGALSNSVTINGTNTVPNAAGVTTADWVILPANTNTRTGSFLVNGLIVR